MEFTHQNLNKDFLTNDQNFKKSKPDDFADFLSIVDAKFQDEKKKTSEIETENPQQVISETSK